MVSRAAAVLLLLGIAGAAYAQTAAGHVSATRAGDGSTAISNYTVSNIQYSLNTTDRRNLDSVTMTLSSTPKSGSTIRVQLASGGTWYTCTNSGTSVTCTTTSPQALATGATQFTLVIAD